MTIEKMQKIKVSELFYSIQGEGLHMGVPSVFLRTFGCNFSCSGFGMPKGLHSTERDAVANNIDAYQSYNDLPLVSTGCDSYASWDTRFKHFSPMLTTDAVARKIIESLPEKRWGRAHLVITGGEPLLGWQRAYPELLDHPLMTHLDALTFETNGTQALSPDLKRYLFNWGIGTEDRGVHAVTFSVSAKLSCSGEERSAAIKPDVVCEYEEVGVTYLKFVVASELDAEEALDTLSVYRANGFEGHCYLMPVGGVEDVYTLNNRRVAELALKNGLRYSDRLQVPLFKNAWST